MICTLLSFYYQIIHLHINQFLIGTHSISKYNTALVEGCCDFLIGTKYKIARLDDSVGHSFQSTTASAN